MQVHLLVHESTISETHVFPTHLGILVCMLDACQILNYSLFKLRRHQTVNAEVLYSWIVA